MPHSAASHLGLHCLLRLVSLNTYCKYGTSCFGLIHVNLKQASFSNFRNWQVVCLYLLGMVRCGEGVVYLTSLGRPSDIGLQLGKACNPCSR